MKKYGNKKKSVVCLLFERFCVKCFTVLITTSVEIGYKPVAPIRQTNHRRSPPLKVDMRHWDQPLSSLGLLWSGSQCK